ncbi:DUF1796 family putative cysteine peptidase [Bacillus cereus]|uniref:DUF1796 family putative cysteine peptidase n=1 Tax=Bacillus cereus TaxID=1396 RepID=UPI003819E5C7
MIILEFKELHGLYDDVISLGENCYTAINLQKYKLRKHSGPLDWFTSPDLSSINGLLKNDFIDFMDLNNMYAMADKNIVFNDGVIQPVSSHIVKDIKYNITSYHDFPVISNKEWSTTYPEFKQKLDRRINNFYKIMEKSQSILFVRWGGNLIETLELQSMLSRIVRNNFKILLLSPTGAENEITTLESGIDHVCTLQVSKNYLNKRTWYILLKDIHLNSKI